MYGGARRIVCTICAGNELDLMSVDMERMRTRICAAGLACTVRENEEATHHNC